MIDQSDELVGGDPVNATDPSGLFGFLPVGEPCPGRCSADIFGFYTFDTAYFGLDAVTTGTWNSWTTIGFSVTNFSCAGCLGRDGAFGWSIPGLTQIWRGGQVIIAIDELTGAQICCTQYHNDAPPKDAEDPKGAKAPGKPGEAEGYHPPKDGPKWVKAPNSNKKGWLDKDGNVWVPSGLDLPGNAAHGGPHWDVQLKGGGYRNVKPTPGHPGYSTTPR